MRQPDSGRSSIGRSYSSLIGATWVRFRTTGALHSTIRENPAVNEQSLERVNAFLAAVADRTEQGRTAGSHAS